MRNTWPLAAQRVGRCLEARRERLRRVVRETNEEIVHVFGKSISSVGKQDAADVEMISKVNGPPGVEITPRHAATSTV